jgi:hypothetical protein
LQCPGDRLDYTVEIIIDFIVCESEESDPERFDVSLPPSIISLRFRSEMAVSIELDRQLGLDAVEIEAEGPDAVLAAKSMTAQLSAAQPRPQDHFGRGHLLAQSAS